MMCCSAKRTLFISQLLMIFFLLGSIVSPWYFSSVEIDEGGIETDIWYLFYWPGYIVNSKTSYPTNFNGTKTMEDVYTIKYWGDFHGSHAAIVYLSSNLLGVGAFFLASIVVVVSFLLLFGNTRKESRVRIQRLLIITCSICTLILNILSWGIFLYWPAALKETTFCTDPEEQSVCSKFVGKTEYIYGSNVYGPFLGWIFAVLATPTILVSILIACFIRAPAYTPRTYTRNDYHSLSVQG